MRTQDKSVILSLLCNLFHYYAFSIYAFSAVILAPIFFYTDSAELTKILGLVTFSITFFLRPLGNIIFGHIGDKKGRKVALIATLVAVTIATTSIGLIPPYAQIGWVSSALLLVCLFVQGLCIGGQYTGALVYIQEHTKKENAAFACGLVGAIGFFGVLLGTATSYFFDLFEGVESWEWRLPFLLSSIVGVVLYFFMRTVKETPIFIENNLQKTENKVPLFNVIKNYKKPFFSAIFISSIPMSMFYIATVYIPNFYFDKTETSGFIDPLALVCLTQALCMVLSPMLGLTADKFGREAQLKFTSILLIVTPIFIFYCITFFSALIGVIIGILLFGFYASLSAGSTPAYLSEKFPVVGRYSGMGLGIAIGEGFGGLTPLVCVFFGQFFDSKLAPAYFIMALGVLSFAGILLSQRPSVIVNQKRWA